MDSWDGLAKILVHKKMETSFETYETFGIPQGQVDMPWPNSLLQSGKIEMPHDATQ